MNEAFLIYEGTKIPVDKADIGYVLRWMYRQWKRGPKRSFQLSVDGTVIAASTAPYSVWTKTLNMYVDEEVTKG